MLQRNKIAQKVEIGICRDNLEVSSWVPVRPRFLLPDLGLLLQGLRLLPQSEVSLGQLYEYYAGGLYGF